MDDATLSAKARTLGSLLEPVTGQVYFSPECHAEYVALGFGPSPGEANGVALPDGPAYFTSRGSVMGQVAGEVIAAAFAVFNPAVVVPCVQLGWTLTDATTICAARDRGAIGQLRRILGDEPEGLARVTAILQRMVEPLRPEGRPLFAGLRSQGLPADPIGAMWRLGDMFREYRGDSHTASWISAGFDATEIGLVSELYWGLPPRSYSRTRSWTTAEFDAATERLRQRGLLDEAGGALTGAGRELREEVEVATDRQMRAAIGAGGEELDELFGLLAPWGADVRAAGGYLASGPHDLAKAASGRG
ncbi:MAG: hypothetical protein AB7Q42_21000 [Acidimicrobiia bacterium]